MADVTLRAYVKEIDNLIERDQLDEAIAHCRHILQTYPKHMETYRLLGKAYLEAKRFGDAADIFQRVLSAVPEDFVSHIGMAIVREDEGNLDAAIWHMERAFEANPANPAIRQELSRLIGRRDGLEPHKIRLTRGALARQYAQGELYPQAIAELRSALQEDPDRPDLEILLAKMYWRSEQYDAAKSLSKQIIEKLPYSFDANRILATIYQVTNNPEKAGEYHRRLAALDPYMAFVDSAASDPGEISASAVQIDQSDWIPGQPLPTVDSAEPDWVASLGVDLSERDEKIGTVDPVPSWMGELEGEVSSRRGGVSAFSSEEPEAALSDEDDIPEWMREAGWGASTGEVEEGPISFSDEELDALDSGGPMPVPEEERGDEEEIAPADIPDWLQDIAPSEIPAEPEAEPDLESETPSGEKREFVPDWLADISSEADDIPPEPVEETQEVETPEAEQPPQQAAVMDIDDEDQPEVPTWVEDQAPGATSTIISWLGDRPGVEAVEGQEPPPTEDPAPEMVHEPETSDEEEEFPSWLEGLDVEEPEEISPAAVPELDDTEQDDEVPSWLAGVADAASDMDFDFGEAEPREARPAPEAEEPEPAPAAEAEEAVDEDAWLRDLAEAGIEEAPEEEQVPDWTAEEQAEVTAEAKPGDVPDWLQGIAPAAEDAVQEEPEPDWMRGLDFEEASAEETSAVPRQEVPEWLQGIAEPSEETDEEEMPPSWLEDFSSEEEAVAPTEPVEDEFDLDSLREFEAEISSEPEQPETPVARPPEDIGVGEDLDDEEVYQWLESLAQEQDQEPEAAAAWTPEHAPEEAAPMIDESLPPEEPEASLDWLEDLASERGIDVDVSAQEDASQLAPEEAEREAPAVEPEMVEEEEEAPDWLREMATSSTDETMVTPRPAEFEAETEPEEPEPEVPDWLEEATTIAADVPAEPGEAEVQIAPEEIEPAPREVPPEPVQHEIPETMEEPVEEPPAGVEAVSTEPEPTQVEPTEVIPEPPAETPVTPPAAIEPAPPEPEPEPESAPEPVAEAPVEISVEPEEIEPEPEVTQPEKQPEKPTKFKEPLTEPIQLLQSARQALSAGDAGRALSDYRKLIDRKEDLDTVIKDLQRAAERYPNLPKVWQALGDAHMKADQLPEAIKAYKRGMEVA